MYKIHKTISFPVRIIRFNRLLTIHCLIVNVLVGQNKVDLFWNEDVLQWKHIQLLILCNSSYTPVTGSWMATYKSEQEWPSSVSLCFSRSVFQLPGLMKGCKMGQHWQRPLLSIMRITTSQSINSFAILHQLAHKHLCDCGVCRVMSAGQPHNKISRDTITLFYQEQLDLIILSSGLEKKMYK